MPSEAERAVSSPGRPASRILVLGGGFGGIAAAVELRSRLGRDHEIELIDRSDAFVMGLRKLWALVGIGSLEGGMRDRADLAARGIRFRNATILSIDPTSRQVKTGNGRESCDYLVVALGAESRPDLVPGLVEHGHDVWDPTGVPRLEAELRRFAGGDIVVAITGMPYTCPPAPFECAMLIDDHLRDRGLRDASTITVTTPKPILLPNAGPDGSRWLAARLDERGIFWRTSVEVERVEEGRLRHADGDLPFDLLIGVPPHRPPAVVASSPLAGPGGWISVDPGTFETSFENVFAVGDVTRVTLANGLPLPKAGLMAELQGRRVGAAIASRILGDEDVPAFDGRGFCFLEMSATTAAYIEGDFYRRPEPSVSILPEADEHAARKHAFEQERLTDWFGG